MLDFKTAFSETVFPDSVSGAIVRLSALTDLGLFVSYLAWRSSFIGFNLGYAAGAEERSLPDGLQFSIGGPNRYVQLADWYGTLGLVFLALAILALFQLRRLKLGTFLALAIARIAALFFALHQIRGILMAKDPRYDELIMSDTPFNALFRESVQFDRFVTWLIVALMLSQLVAVGIVVRRSISTERGASRKIASEVVPKA